MPKRSAIDKLLKSGEVIRGDDNDLEIQRLPIGIPPLDEITGGGFPLGGYTLIVGPESTGKTIIAQYAAVAQQKTNRPEILYLDTEHSYDPQWWKDSGVDIEKVWVARPVTAEQLIDVAAAFMEDSDDVGMVILDSLAALPPAKIVEESAERRDVASLAGIATKMYQKLTPMLNKRVFIVTNQLRENMAGYEEVYPGGRAQRFYAHIILRTRRQGWIEGDNKERIGFNVEVAVRKNKTAPPLGVATIPFRFRGQFDLLSVRLDELIAVGKIQEHLPYYWVMIDGEDPAKILGKRALRNYFEEDPARIDRM